MMDRNKRKILFGVAWICVWAIVALCVNNQIFFAGPVETVKAFFGFFIMKEFYLAVAGSFLRIAIGFMTGFAVACLLAYCSFRWTWVEDFCAPLMTLIKTVPVASFVVLLLIWWGSQPLSAIISFLVVLPQMYISTLEGLKNADKQLLEMAHVFVLPKRTFFYYIYREALVPFWNSSVKVALGMCWKAGIAAELIGVPTGSIGENMYLTKVYIDVPGLFAWTIVVVLLSICMEKIVLFLMQKWFAYQPKCTKPLVQHKEDGGYIRLENICKEYPDRPVISGLSAEYQKDQVYCLNSPSGSGKTTLLKILAGLVTPDEGVMEKHATCAMMFQEDRLCESYNAIKNVELVLGDSDKAKKALLTLLTEEDIYKPCAELSGGQKRRVALVRAMEAEADFVLLDEPFTGMDTDTIEKAKKYIERKSVGKAVVMATHI